MSFFQLLVFSILIIYIQSVIIRTPNGDILGTSSNDTDSFLGVRYGQIPARWLPAALPKPWTDIYNATEFGSICHQLGPYKQFIPLPESEDCLFLNIWVPKTANTSLLPVRVWIHGGGYTAGYSNDYPGDNLAALSQSIIITINYRLGLFGFFSLPSLNTVNLGWLDQQLALKWIQENIASFGGDKTNVMMFGQSAGGGSVIAHLFIESSWPLYSSIIVESGGPFHLENCKDQENRNFELLKTTYPQCQSSLSCYQELDGSKFYEDLNVNWVTFWPCLGEKSQLPDKPLALFRKGLFNKNAAVLGGFNSNEGQSVTFTFNFFNNTVSQARYHELSEQYQMPSELVNRYDPTTTDKDYFNAFAWLLGDYYCNCPTMFLFNHLANLSSAPIYVYSFIHPTENWAFSPLHFNATHLTEIPYVFNNNFAFTQLTPSETMLSLKIIAYFTSFHLSIPPWISYRNNKTIISLDIGNDGIKTHSNFNPELIQRCSHVLKYLDDDDCHAYLNEQECSSIKHCQWYGNHCDNKSTPSAAPKLQFSFFLFLFLFFLL